MIKRKLEVLDKCRGVKYQPFVCAINILGYAATHVGISISSPAADGLLVLQLPHSLDIPNQILIIEDEDN